MTSEQVLKIKSERLHKLSHSVKNEKCPGVVRKLTRQVRNLEKLT